MEAPGIFFQPVPECKTAKNRVHLDLKCDDLKCDVVPDEVARRQGLGASLVAEHDDHAVGRDPEGNEFCLSAEG